MKRTFAGVIAVALAGCGGRQNEWAQPGVIMAQDKALDAATRAEMKRWEKSVASTKVPEPGPGGLISGGRVRKSVTASAGSPAGEAPRGRLAAVEQAVRVLTARVERLEAKAGAPARRARAPRAVSSGKSFNIYTVSPDGQAAWVAAGSAHGVKEGQLMQVVRGGQVVAQVQVAKVWPKVSELLVIVSTGGVKKGDKAVPK